jgi:hypothetical protein
MSKLVRIEEVNQMIDRGEVLTIAADESFLKKLRPGYWIGGSIPYFMSEEGGLFSKDYALVSSFSSVSKNFRIVEYTPEQLSKISSDYFNNGFSIIIIPSQSEAHSEFSKNSFSYPQILNGNLVGWISGVDLNSSSQKALVYNGVSGNGALHNKAVVLHCELPAGKFAKTEILNIFEENDASDVIEFFETGYEITDCRVNGEKKNFAEYLREIGADPRFPLVADFSGAKINVSFKEVLEGRVSLYASIYPMVKYRLSKPVTNYELAFDGQLQNMNGKTPLFSCNCILNYLYANLEGKKCGAPGPLTFGEIAYILLNQTIVNLWIENDK